MRPKRSGDGHLFIVILKVLVASTMKLNTTWIYSRDPIKLLMNFYLLCTLPKGPYINMPFIQMHHFFSVFWMNLVSVHGIDEVYKINECD